MLVEAIWGPEAGDGSRKTLQVFVSSLRKALNACEPGAGARLAFEGGGYRLDVDAETIDIFRFEQLASRARAHLAGGRPEQAVPLLDEALSLWRGPALADFAYESWAQPHVSRLDEAHAGCLEDRVDALLQLGRHSELVGDLEARIAQDPLRERPRGQLMLALYRAGRQADALAAYQDARDALVGQLGIEPSPELRDLHRGILAQDPALSPPPQRPPRADEAAPLPIPATRLVGRQREAVELSELLQHGDAQLITLTGAGGTGKTRLSIEVGTRVSDHFEDGVHWVPLDSIRDAGLFLPTLASTLGTEQRGGTLVDVICDRLAGRRVLVIIDNAEHLLPDVATDVASLRSGCPSATWLVTSRERLRVLGERVYPVQPLAPDDAARLFTARAHDSGVSVDVDEGVNELCRRLDGLPLAIELAAACMPSFTPSQLLSRLSDSPELLTGGRDVDSRQRTLRAAIGWSYDLLGDQERRLFARLAVFSGGCVLEAAEQVCEADLGALASLVETSLVHRVGERFAMLETIRQYALERLEASTQVEPLRERHQEWCLALCERLAPDLKGPLAGERFDQLEAEHANLQAALQHALDNGSAEAALRMTGALWSYWHVRGHWSEGRRWLESALAIATSSGTGWHVESHLGAGIMAAWQGDWTIAAAHADALLALGSKREIPRAEGLGLKLHGLLATFRGDYPRSIALHERVLPIAEAEDDQPWFGTTLNDLGYAVLNTGDFARALSLFQRSLTVAEGAGHQSLRLVTLGNMGFTSIALQDRTGARPFFHESLALATELGMLEDVMYGLVGLAAAHHDTDPPLAARLLGSAETMRETLGLPELQAFERAMLDETVAHLRAVLGEAAWKSAYADGRRQAPSQVVAEALDADGRGADTVTSVKPA